MYTIYVVFKCFDGKREAFVERVKAEGILADILAEDGDPINEATVEGLICRQPTYRRTPLGREICDLMLAVNRHYGRSDYLPCICWGQRARQAALWPVGTKLSLSGRIQSRSYIKMAEDGPLAKTAFEVSVTELHPPEAPG